MIKDFIVGTILIILLYLFVLACDGIASSVTCNETILYVIIGFVSMIGIFILEKICGVI